MTDTRPEPISVEQFFAPPQRAAETISPDGARIAYLAPWRERLNVWVDDADFEDAPVRVTADDRRNISTYRWTSDSRWILYSQDTGGDENWHIFHADPDAPAVDLTPFPGARALSFDLPVGKPGIVLTQLNHRRADRFDLVEIDITTGELTTIAENPGGVAGWLYAGAGAIYAQTITAAGDLELSRWDERTGSLQSVVVFDGSDYPLGPFPVAITPDGSGVWIGSNRGTDRTRLVRVDLATAVETEVDSHPSFDIDARAQIFDALPSPLITHRGTGEIVAVRYLGERQVIRSLDRRFDAVLDRLETLSDGDLASVSSDETAQRWVVSFTHDRVPGVTYYYDHATGRSRELFRARPDLDPATLAPMTPVTIRARDGLELPSYLTLPLGVAPSNLPMVLMVHGGPWTRDAWGYNGGVQLLANRGYAVLQVNFRGSTGFGKAFTQAGIGEFAGKMHDDLIDAVDWAVRQGYADRDRVAIFGGSYGGYAALVGVTFTPDVFAAAVDYVGISNLANFMRSLPAFAKGQLINNWFGYVGDPDDPDQLADMMARSPITRVDDISTPLLVLQGANDVRVVQAESDNMVAALRERGVDTEYIVFDDEGHLFSQPHNLITMFSAIETFLADHLKTQEES